MFSSRTKVRVDRGCWGVGWWMWTVAFERVLSVCVLLLLSVCVLLLLPVGRSCRGFVCVGGFGG